MASFNMVQDSVMKATDHLEVPSATEELKMFILFHFNLFTFIYENICLFICSSGDETSNLGLTHARQALYHSVIVPAATSSLLYK